MRRGWLDGRKGFGIVIVRLHYIDAMSFNLCEVAMDNKPRPGPGPDFIQAGLGLWVWASCLMNRLRVDAFLIQDPLWPKIPKHTATLCH